jgi:hypothetical protein
MPSFEDIVHHHYDVRISTLGKIKSRSLGADMLTLVALTVLAYAQLEGGVKDLASCVIRHVNYRNLQLGQITPQLLTWRNPDELNQFKSLITFENVAEARPFSKALERRTKIRSIDRRFELNQMGWASLKNVYGGFGLTLTEIERSAAEIDALVEARNQAAHYGIPPSTASSIIENQLRGYVTMVEAVLTDLSLQLLPFFSDRMHLRK